MSTETRVPIVSRGEDITGAELPDTDTLVSVEHTDAWAMAAPIPRGLRPASAELDELDPFLSSKGES